MLLVQSKTLQDFATTHGLDLSAAFTDPSHRDLHQRLIAANADMAMAVRAEAKKNTDDDPTDGEAAGLKATGLEENSTTLGHSTGGLNGHNRALLDGGSETVSETPNRVELPNTTDTDNKDKSPVLSETTAPKTLAEAAARLGLHVQEESVNTLGADIAVERELGSDITGAGTGTLRVALLATDKDSDTAATLGDESRESTKSKGHDEDDFPSSQDDDESVDTTGTDDKTLQDKDKSSQTATENGEERSGKTPFVHLMNKMGSSPRPGTSNIVFTTTGNDGERIEITATANNVARLPGTSTTVTLTTANANANTRTITTAAMSGSNATRVERVTRSSDKGDNLMTTSNDDFVYDALNSTNSILVDGYYVENPEYKRTAKDRQSYLLDKDESLVYHPKYSEGGIGGINYFTSAVKVATPAKKRSLASLGISSETRKALKEVLSRPDIKNLKRKDLNAAIKQVSDKINPPQKNKRQKTNPAGNESEDE